MIFASAATAFNTFAVGVLWTIIIGAILLFGALMALHKRDVTRMEKDDRKFRHRGTSAETKEKIARGELGPGGYPKRRSKN
jgi:uncharacterized membrane protein